MGWCRACACGLYPEVCVDAAWPSVVALVRLRSAWPVGLVCLCSTCYFACARSLMSQPQPPTLVQDQHLGAHLCAQPLQHRAPALPRGRQGHHGRGLQQRQQWWGWWQPGPRQGSRGGQAPGAGARGLGHWEGRQRGRRRRRRRRGWAREPCSLRSRWGQRGWGGAGLRLEPGGPAVDVLPRLLGHCGLAAARALHHLPRPQP